MKKQFVALAIVSSFLISKSPALSFDDIQFWIGSGTNRAALVIEWSAPESALYSTVPAPIADKSLAWGYRFNGMATGTQMLQAILAADPRLYVVADETYGSTFVEGIGFNLDGAGLAGITDGSVTNYFTNNFLASYNGDVDIDNAYPLDTNDLYWGGYDGPNWESWTEPGDAGGFLNCPDRGTNTYWTPTDTTYFSTGYHGQWNFAQTGLDYLTLTNGSWIGFSVAAGEYEGDASAPYNTHKHAPAVPDVSVTALIKNLSGNFQDGQWQSQFGSVSNWLYTLQRSPDLQSWIDVPGATLADGTNLILQDTNPPAVNAFYRVRAEHP